MNDKNNWVISFLLVGVLIFSFIDITQENSIVIDYSQPYCRIDKTTKQSIGNILGVEVLYDSEVSDLLNMHSILSNTGKIIINEGKSGLYQIEVQIAFQANGNGFREAYLLVNASHVDNANAGVFNMVAPATELTIMRLSVTTYLGDNAYIQVYVYQNSGISLDLWDYYNWFSVVRISQEISKE